MRTHVLGSVILLFLLVGAGLASSPVAAADDIAEDLSLTVSDGPNGEYAAVDEDGRVGIRVGGDATVGGGINVNARTRIDDVLTVHNRGSSQVALWIADEPGVITLVEQREGRSLHGVANCVVIPSDERRHIGVVADIDRDGTSDDLHRTLRIRSHDVSPGDDGCGSSEPPQPPEQPGSGGAPVEPMTPSSGPDAATSPGSETDGHDRPVVRAIVPADIAVGESVSLEAEVLNRDPDEIEQIIWRLPNGSTKGGWTIDHVFEDETEHAVEVVAVDRDGRRGHTTVRVAPGSVPRVTAFSGVKTGTPLEALLVLSSVGLSILAFRRRKRRSHRV